MGFGQIGAVLRARWKIALAVVAFTVLIAVVISLVLPKQYLATASVVVDIKPDPVSAVIYPGMASPQYMATQVDIIQSDRVAQRVVRNLKLADNPQVRQQWQEATDGQGDIVVWLSDVFQKNMDVRPSRESNVITVSYKAPDPKFAAGLANAFVQAYVDTALELRVDPAKQYTSFFDTRAKEAREALEKAQARLSAFQKEKGIIAADERLDIENARLNELSSQLVALQALTAESSSRQSQATSAGADRLQEVITNPLIAGLKSDLSRQEARLKEISARLGDNNPQVIELKENIAELRSRLDSETRRVTGSVGLNNSINKQREAQIRAELDAQRAKVLQMKQVRDEGSVLVRDVENAQRTYDAVLQRLNQTALESQATQGNIYVLAQATPPSQPSSPKVVLNTAVALFLGLILGIGVALGLEMTDRRVRAVDDVVRSIGLPVLGSLPPPKKNAVAKARQLQMQQRLLSHVPPAAKGA
jgi:chain length determinant protein EpsF